MGERKWSWQIHPSSKLGNKIKQTTCTLRHINATVCQKCRPCPVFSSVLSTGDFRIPIKGEEITRALRKAVLPIKLFFLSPMIMLAQMEEFQLLRGEREFTRTIFSTRLLGCLCWAWVVGVMMGSCVCVPVFVINLSNWHKPLLMKCWRWIASWSDYEWLML